MKKTLCDICHLEISTTENSILVMPQSVHPDGTAELLQPYDMHPACYGRMISAVQENVVATHPDPGPTPEVLPPTPDPVVPPVPAPAPDPEVSAPPGVPTDVTSEG